MYEGGFLTSCCARQFRMTLSKVPFASSSTIFHKQAAARSTTSSFQPALDPSLAAAAASDNFEVPNSKTCFSRRRRMLNVNSFSFDFLFSFFVSSFSISSCPFSTHTCMFLYGNSSSSSSSSTTTTTTNNNSVPEFPHLFCCWCCCCKIVCSPLFVYKT